MKRLVIIEDQTAIREMLVEILRLDANYQLVGEAGDGQSAVQLCLEANPDVCVLDAKLPGLNGVDILRRISKKLPQMRVLVFSGHENPVLVREMLEAGAHGFVEKTAGLLALKNLCLASASAALLFTVTGCPSKPARPKPTQTVLPMKPSDTSSAAIPPTDLGTMAPGTNLEPRLGEGVIDDGNTIRGLLQPVYFDFDRWEIKAAERPKAQAAKDYLAKN